MDPLVVYTTMFLYIGHHMYFHTGRSLNYNYVLLYLDYRITNYWGPFY